MSGIYGIWNPSLGMESEANRKRLGSWNQAYGKKTETKLVGEHTFMGCAYESYSDKTVLCHPVINWGEKYAVIDALLYNREELIEKGTFEAALSDEELLFSYVEAFGFDALKYVNGDFAGAVYDGEKNSWTLFRDHMGTRPLFYCGTKQGLAFSTDIRGLISMESTDVSVDEKWLWSKLTGTICEGTENTEFAHIFCVKPASYLQFSVSGETICCTKETYWIPGGKKIRLSSEEAYKRQLKELITDSIKRRLDAVSGPVGAELSGGMDSSVIDILIHRLGREAFYFSWSLSPEEVPYAENDERKIVEDICRQENITCRYSEKGFNFGKDSIIYKKMQEIGREPDMKAGLYRRYVLPPYISTVQIGQVAQSANRCGAKVVFTGHAGDEGVSHRCNPYELFYHKEYAQYFKYMWESTKGEKNRIYKMIRRCHKNLVHTRKKLRNPFVSIYESKDMLKKEFYERYYSEKGTPLTFAYDPVSYVRNGGSRNRLDIVALLGAYCGARYIAPYVDYRVMDYALSIPRHMYLKHQRNRYIFKETFKDMIPESLYELTGKEDTSWRNVEKGEKDPKEYSERKKRLVSMLDREYWKEYLDWEVLDSWAEVALAEADEARDFAMFSGIDNCLSLQNLITFSKIG